VGVEFGEFGSGGGVVGEQADEPLADFLAPPGGGGGV